MANAFAELYQGITGLPSGIKSIYNTGQTQLANATGTKVNGLNYNSDAVSPSQAQLQAMHDQGNYVRDVNSGAQVLGASTTKNNSYTAPTGNPQDIAQYDQAIAQYEANLNRLPTQQAIAAGNINRQFDTSRNELTSGRAQAEQTYNQNTAQNGQQFVTNKNNIRDTASAGLRGLMRTLGAYGAGGTDTGVARNAVLTQATRDQAGAGEAFGQNQQGIDSSWGNYGINYGNEERKLNDWKTGQLQTAEQTGLTSKQSILQTLAQLRAQRASAAGGNPTASAQPYLDQANALNGQIDQLGAINPTYTGNTPVYQAPDIASYSTNPNAQVETAQNAGDSLTAPWLAALLGKDKKQQPAYAQ